MRRRDYALCFLLNYRQDTDEFHEAADFKVTEIAEYRRVVCVLLDS